MRMKLKKRKTIHKSKFLMRRHRFPYHHRNMLTWFLNRKGRARTWLLHECTGSKKMRGSSSIGDDIQFDSYFI